MVRDMKSLDEAMNYIRFEAAEEDLVEIAGYITQRRQALREQRAANTRSEIAVGKWVKIASSGIKPKYLAGQMGTVAKIQESRALIPLDWGPQGKFRDGKVLVPMSALEVIR